MQVLCEGPRISGAVSALPAGTRALAAFVDPDDQAVVLDFSQRTGDRASRRQRRRDGHPDLDPAHGGPELPRARAAA